MRLRKRLAELEERVAELESADEPTEWTTVPDAADIHISSNRANIWRDAAPEHASHATVLYDPMEIDDVPGGVYL